MVKRILIVGVGVLFIGVGLYFFPWSELAPLASNECSGDDLKVKIVARFDAAEIAFENADIAKVAFSDLSGYPALNLYLNDATQTRIARQTAAKAGTGARMQLTVDGRLVSEGEVLAEIKTNPMTSLASGVTYERVCLGK